MIELKSSGFDKDGLKYDRTYILYDGAGEMQTRRNCPGMADFDLTIIDGKLNVYSRVLKNSILLDGGNDNSRSKKLPVWSRLELGLNADALMNQFFSGHFGKNVELFSIKKSTDSYASFHDACPFLICNRTSIAYLENKTGRTIDIMRFRPNLIVTGENAFDEKHWKDLSIGKNNFTSVKLCSRCIIINQDPETGIQDLNLLKLIKPYTRDFFKINFGLYLKTSAAGMMSVGEDVLVSK